MKFPVLAILAAGVALQTAAQGREKRQEVLEEMWPVYQKMDCSSENIDAATILADNHTYFFKGDFYWGLYHRYVDLGYPRYISQDWDTLPGNLDAALTWNNRTYFFKGHEYWSFHGKKMDSGYPRNISDGFCGIPDNLDAAMKGQNDRSAYFLKGDLYWKFDGGDSCNSIPSSISSRLNIPSNVDATVQWLNAVYYIKGGYYYYGYNGNNTSNEFPPRAGDPYPLHGNWGLKCSELNRLIPSEYQSGV